MVAEAAAARLAEAVRSESLSERRRQVLVSAAQPLHPPCADALPVVDAHSCRPAPTPPRSASPACGQKQPPRRRNHRSGQIPAGGRRAEPAVGPAVRPAQRADRRICRQRRVSVFVAVQRAGRDGAHERQQIWGGGEGRQIRLGAGRGARKWRTWCRRRREVVAEPQSGRQGALPAAPPGRRCPATSVKSSPAGRVGKHTPCPTGARTYPP